MNGSGILRGLLVTFKHFVETYLEDIRKGKSRYGTKAGIESRRDSSVTGVFTIQYPEEKMPVPEEFRYIPFLIYETGESGAKNYRCTSCGICAKVCPPQCIWIQRTNDPVTGKPVPTPKEFFVDVDICMNCGLCAEYCPFDAIKMDHDYEIASTNRIRDNIYNLEKLGRPLEYYSKIRPANYEREEAVKQAARDKKAAAV
jgi:NADH-quinone oxidoreductase subunit I